jgi:hypothetical protein
MKRWRFHIAMLGSTVNDVSTWDFNAPDEETAILIGKGHAFNDEWEAYDTQSWVAEIKRPPGPS